MKVIIDRRGYGLGHRQHDLLHLAKMLDQAMACVKALEGRAVPQQTDCGHGEAVPLEDWALLAAMHDCLDHITDAIPEVECWCIVKHYRTTFEFESRPARWLGFTDKKQAEAFRVVIERFYNEEKWQKHWGDEKDRWTVERLPLNINNVVSPKMTPEEWLDNARRCYV